MVKLGTFVALGVRGVKSLRIGVLTWVSFMLKWVKQIGICKRDNILYIGWYQVTFSGFRIN